MIAELPHYFTEGAFKIKVHGIFLNAGECRMDLVIETCAPIALFAS